MGALQLLLSREKRTFRKKASQKRFELCEMKSFIVYTRRGRIPDVSKGIESWNNVLFLESVVQFGMERVLGEF